MKMAVLISIYLLSFIQLLGQDLFVNLGPTLQPCPNVISAGPTDFVPPDHIQVIAISITKKCETFNRAIINVTCKDGVANQYSYSLDDGDINQAGVFDNVVPGKHAISITTINGERKDTLVTVPEYFLNVHPVRLITHDGTCGVNGSVAFSSSMMNDPASYSIKTDGIFYPINHLFSVPISKAYHFSVVDHSGCIVDTLYANVRVTTCQNIIINTLSIQKDCNSIKLATINISALPIGAPYNYRLSEHLSNATGVFKNVSAGVYHITITSPVSNNKDTIITVPDYYATRPITTYNTIWPQCDISGSIQLFVKGDAVGNYSVGLGSTIYASDHIFTGLVAKSYLFSILTADGCIVDSLSIPLERKACGAVVFPTTFTPNHDGVNDIFRAALSSTAKSFDLKIFSRNGSLIFATKSIHTGWDGTYLNKDVAIGTYYWIASYSNTDGKPILEKGSITLIR
jgi:gliding motility-associated-like protein